MTTPAGTAPGHLPSTYTALCSLALLRAPLDRLDRAALRRFLCACQAKDGSFTPVPGAPGAFQNDTRMSYCASVARAVAGVGGLEQERAVEREGMQEQEEGWEEDIDVGAARAFLARCRVRHCEWRS